MSFLFQNHRITPPLIQTVTIILTTVDSINNMQAIQSDIPPVNCNLSQQSCQDKNFLSSPDFVDSSMENIYRPAASRQYFDETKILVYFHPTWIAFNTHTALGPFLCYMTTPARDVIKKEFMFIHRIYPLWAPSV